MSEKCTCALSGWPYRPCPVHPNPLAEPASSPAPGASEGLAEVWDEGFGVGHLHGARFGYDEPGENPNDREPTTNPYRDAALVREAGANETVERELTLHATIREHYDARQRAEQQVAADKRYTHRLETENAGLRERMDLAESQVAALKAAIEAWLPRLDGVDPEVADDLRVALD